MIVVDCLKKFLYYHQEHSIIHRWLPETVFQVYVLLIAYCLWSTTGSLCVIIRFGSAVYIIIWDFAIGMDILAHYWILLGTVLFVCLWYSFTYWIVLKGCFLFLVQDLPNYAQHTVPIFSLPQEWLWCESWCGNATKSRAKTIDLCNNPMTKEPKLQVILPLEPWFYKYGLFL